MDGEDLWGAKILPSAILCWFFSPCPRPPLTDSLATAALVGLEMLRLQRGGGMENVGNSSVSLISQISIECQPHCSPSPKQDDGLHVERSFASYPCSIHLLFAVYFYAVYLHEPKANTSPSSSSQSGRFIGKSNQVLRGKSFPNVSAKQRARLNWLDYKKGRESHLLFPPCSSWTALSSPRSTPPSLKPKRASMTQDSHVIPRHPPPPRLPPATESQIISNTLNLARQRDHEQGFQ